MEIPKSILRFLGDAYVCASPLWFTYKPTMHKVKGHQVREVLNCVIAGDILLHRQGGYLNTVLLPGFWSHAGLFVGNDRIIHAIGEGVVHEDVIDFCRTDAVCVLRVKNLTPEQLQKAIVTANRLEIERVGYDYTFRSDNGTVYCTEFVDICYNGLFKDDYRPQPLNHIVLEPDHIFSSDKVDQILVIK